MKKCRSCQSEIDDKAKKCPHCQTKQGNWIKRHPILTVIIVLFVFIIFSPKDDNKTPQKSEPSKPTATEVTEKADNTQVSPTAAVTNDKPSETISQKNAVRKAESYLSVMAFSKTGLIKQLEYDKFSNTDATYAVDNVAADWSEQAAKKAKSYLDAMAFSRGSLISQLEYDGFTTEQATYGADSVGL